MGVRLIFGQKRLFDLHAQTNGATRLAFPKRRRNETRARFAQESQQSQCVGLQRLVGKARRDCDAGIYRHDERNL